MTAAVHGGMVRRGGPGGVLARLRRRLRRWLVPELEDATHASAWAFSEPPPPQPTPPPIKSQQPFQEFEALLNMSAWLLERDAKKFQEGREETLSLVLQEYSEQLGFAKSPPSTLN